MFGLFITIIIIAACFNIYRWVQNNREVKSNIQQVSNTKIRLEIAIEEANETAEAMRKALQSDPNWDGHNLSLVRKYLRTYEEKVQNVRKMQDEYQQVANRAYYNLEKQRMIVNSMGGSDDLSAIAYRNNSRNMNEVSRTNATFHIDFMLISNAQTYIKTYSGTADEKAAANSALEIGHNREQKNVPVVPNAEEKAAPVQNETVFVQAKNRERFVQKFGKTMICRVCKIQILDTDQYCWNCGAQRGPSPEERTAAHNRKYRWLAYLVVSCVIFTVFSAVYVVGSGKLMIGLRKPQTNKFSAEESASDAAGQESLSDGQMEIAQLSEDQQMQKLREMLQARKNGETLPVQQSDQQLNQGAELQQWVDQYDLQGSAEAMREFMEREDVRQKSDEISDLIRQGEYDQVFQMEEELLQQFEEEMQK